VQFATEVIIAHPPRVQPVRAVRSTLIQSSIKSLREAGHLERWRALVDPAHRARLEEAIAPEWLPIEVVMAHYAACDALQLSAHELNQLGEQTGQRLNGTLLSALTNSIRSAGFNPWLALPHFDRLHARLFQGASAQFVRRGPKDLSIEWRGMSLYRTTYYRHAYCGFVRSVLKLLAARSTHVTAPHWDELSEQFTVRAAWV
jgi:hypothetical protein